MIRVIGIFLGLVWIAGPASSLGFTFQCQSEVLEIEGGKVVSTEPIQSRLSFESNGLVEVHAHIITFLDWVDQDNPSQFVFSNGLTTIIERQSEDEDKNPQEVFSNKSEFTAVQILMDDGQIFISRSKCSK